MKAYPEDVVVNLSKARVAPYAPPATSFADEVVHPPVPVVPIAPRPQAARDRNPRMTAPLVQTTFNVPAGSVGEYRWRSRLSGKWDRWSTRPGPCTIRQPLACDLGEFRVRPAGVEFEPPEPVALPSRHISRET